MKWMEENINNINIKRYNGKEVKSGYNISESVLKNNSSVHILINKYSSNFHFSVNTSISFSFYLMSKTQIESLTTTILFSIQLGPSLAPPWPLLGLSLVYYLSHNSDFSIYT
jgi:hypothetical protein